MVEWRATNVALGSFKLKSKYQKQPTEKSSEITMLEFVKRNKLKHLNIIITRDAKNLDENGKPRKRIHEVLPKWQNKTYEELEAINAERVGYTSMAVRLDDSNLMVVDDDSEGGNALNEKYKGVPYTLSTRGKKHYWFKKHHEDNNVKNVATEGATTDYLYQQVFESIGENAKMVGDFTNLPVFTDFVKKPILKMSTPKLQTKTHVPVDLGKSGYVEEIAMNISPKLIEGYKDWICFIHACASSGVSKQVCISVSSRSCKYRKEADCKIINDIYAVGEYKAGMGTLCFLSRKSNAKAHDSIQFNEYLNEERLGKLITKDFSDINFAKAYIALRKDTLGLTLNNELCFFDNKSISWCFGMEAESRVRNDLTETLVRLLKSQLRKKQEEEVTCDRVTRADLPHVREDLEEIKIENIKVLEWNTLIGKICAKLGSQPKRKLLLECVKDLAFNECQRFNIDRMPGTEKHIHFSDVIYDAGTGETIPYMPEAYCSRKLHYKFPRTEPEKTDELRGIISQIFPDEYERETYLTSIAFGLTAHTHWEQHTNTNGLPRAGKSLIAHDLASSAFGIYHMTCPSNLFSYKFEGRRKKFFSTALAKPIRFATMEEMEMKYLDEPTFKAWTSGGQMSVDRDHDQEALEAVSMVSFFSLTNDPLNLSNIQGITSNRLNALKERIAFFSMRSRFVDENEVEEEKQKGQAQYVFIKDTSLKHKLSHNVKYHEAFAWIMLEHWQKLRDMKWKKPDYKQLNAALDEHLLDNEVGDDVIDWLTNSYEPSKTNWISIEQLMSDCDNNKITKAQMRDKVYKAFGYNVPDAGAMYDKGKRVNGRRGAVRLAGKSGMGWSA